MARDYDKQQGQGEKQNTLANAAKESIWPNSSEFVSCLIISGSGTRWRLKVVEAEDTKTVATTDAPAGRKHKPQQYGYGGF
jgi:hypothetical protein